MPIVAPVERGTFEMAEAGCETELKFEIDPSAAQSLRAQAPLADGNTAELSSTYFDTPDGELYDHGMVLRVRKAGSRYLQTLKVARGRGGFERDEWETEIGGSTPDLGILRRTPAAGALAGKTGLQPLFETAVARRSAMWRAEGAEVEVSLDEGEVRAGNAHEPILELELELKAGEPAALFRLARELGRTIPLRLSFEAKSDRGYRLTGRPGGLEVEDEAIRPGRPLAAAFRALARDCVAQIASHARELEKGRSARSLHQTRVGLRRFRAALSVFKPMLGGTEGFDKVRGEARWLAKALDTARDLDVFIEGALPADGERTKGVSGLRRRLEEAREDAYGEALDAIASPRFGELLLDASEWIELGAWSRPDTPERKALLEAPVERFAAHALERRRKRVIRGGRKLARLSPEDRHELRIEGKKLRYAAELLGPAFGDEAAKPREAFIDAAKRLQDRLGELNDIAVAEETARHAAEGEAPAVAFAAGVLVGRRQCQEPALIAAAGKTYKALKRAGRFWR